MVTTYLYILLVIPLALATDRPIIGILTEEVDQDTYPGYSSIIAASYVKAVEQSGARVVPILINRTEEYYRKIVNSINGVVLPGGWVELTTVGGYAAAGRVIVNLAKQINNEQSSFPILGICLGFELLVYLQVNSTDVLSQCDVLGMNLPLEFTVDFRNSHLYGEAPQEIVDLLSSQSVTFNHHKVCVTEALLDQFSVAGEWKVLSTSAANSNNTTKFVSSAEHYNYPFVGVIFHPEKVAYEWVKNRNIPHSKMALIASRYFYDWLVQEARKNNNSFISTEEEYNATHLQFSCHIC